MAHIASNVFISSVQYAFFFSIVELSERLIPWLMKEPQP